MNESTKSSYHQFVFDSCLVEPENRMAFVLAPFMFRAIYLDNYRGGLSSVFAADEDFSPMYFGYTMHVALRDIIHLKASQLHESGILAHNFTKEYQVDIKSRPEAIGPQVLTFQHLEAGFFVIVVCLGVSIVAFAVECAPKKEFFAEREPSSYLICFSQNEGAM
jgi:hypothetical protein